MAPTPAWDVSTPSTSTFSPFPGISSPFPTSYEVVPSENPPGSSLFNWEANSSTDGYSSYDNDLAPPPKLKLAWLSFVLICIAGIVLNIGVFCKRKISKWVLFFSLSLSLSFSLSVSLSLSLSLCLSF